MKKTKEILIEIIIISLVVLAIYFSMQFSVYMSRDSRSIEMEAYAKKQKMKNY